MQFLAKNAKKFIMNMRRHGPFLLPRNLCKSATRVKPGSGSAGDIFLLCFLGDLCERNIFLFR